MAQVRDEIAALDRELAEIELLVGQARVEAARHEQKRIQATERLAEPDRKASAAEVAEAYATLVTLTKRAVLMESQVDVLEGKRKALARHRASLTAVVEQLEGTELEAGVAAGESLPPGLSRVVLSAQEDLRREIARAMHDGPAQSLTNIVLQAQIVDRYLAKDPAHAAGELKHAGLDGPADARRHEVVHLRRAPDGPRRPRPGADPPPGGPGPGRRVQVPVEFESLGGDRRLPMELESTIFRILDEALAAYLGLGPERVVMQLDWGERLEARVVAFADAAPSSSTRRCPRSPRATCPTRSSR